MKLVTRDEAPSVTSSCHFYLWGSWASPFCVLIGESGSQPRDKQHGLALSGSPLCCRAYHALPEACEGLKGRDRPLAQQQDVGGVQGPSHGRLPVSEESTSSPWRHLDCCCYL